MRLHQFKKLVYNKGNNNQSENTDHRMDEKSLSAIHLTRNWYPEYIKRTQKLQNQRTK
jgi:hypothetical protein